MSVSGFASTARAIAGMPRADRTPLVLALAAQRDALHPALRPRAQGELDVLAAGFPWIDVEIRLQAERRPRAEDKRCQRAGLALP